MEVSKGVSKLFTWGTVVHRHATVCRKQRSVLTQVRTCLREKTHLWFQNHRRAIHSAINLQWTLLYDMLLEWIDPKNRNLHVIKNLREHSDDRARDVAPFVYADNLATCSAAPCKVTLLILRNL
jgi:hypothetical protein